MPRLDGQPRKKRRAISLQESRSIEAMMRQKKTCREIATALGLTYAAVHWHGLHKLSLVFGEDPGRARRRRERLFGKPANPSAVDEMLAAWRAEVASWR